MILRRTRVVGLLLLAWCVGAALSAPLSGVVQGLFHHDHAHELPAHPVALAKAIEHGHAHDTAAPPHTHRFELVAAVILVLWIGRLAVVAACAVLGVPVQVSRLAGRVRSHRRCGRDVHLRNCVLLT